MLPRIILPQSNLAHLTRNGAKSCTNGELALWGTKRMTYDLNKFGLHDMIDAGRRLREPDFATGCMETAASAVVDFFYDNLVSPNSDGEFRNCVLARCFKTHPYGDLPLYLQQRTAASFSGNPLRDDTQCLTLLATRGHQTHWNSRHTSAWHQAIPLPTVEILAKAPMIYQLVCQLGIDVEHVVNPEIQPENFYPPFEVFHVETAMGSPMVPQQEQFVKPFGIQSVVGFGGLLPAGDLFAVILFTRVTISPQTASLFRTLALSVKLALLPFSGKQVFVEPC